MTLARTVTARVGSTLYLARVTPHFARISVVVDGAPHDAGQAFVIDGRFRAFSRPTPPPEDAVRALERALAETPPPVPASDP